MLPPPFIDLFGIALKGGILWFKGKLTEHNAASRIFLELTKLGKLQNLAKSLSVKLSESEP